MLARWLLLRCALLAALVLGAPMDDESEAVGNVEAAPVTVAPTVTPATAASPRAATGGGTSGGWGGDSANRARMWSQDFAEGDSRLMRMKGATKSVGGQGSSAPGWWEPVCDGLPSVMIKSDIVAPNGGCPSAQTGANLSCTCITSLNTSSTWAFRLKYKTSQPTSYPLTFDSADVLEVTGVMSLTLPPQVTTLRLVGEGNDASRIDMSLRMKKGGWGGWGGDDSPALGRSESKNALTEAELTNFDLSAIEFKSGFVPSTVKKLTMRSCNISKVTTDFLKSLDSLEELDLSNNNLGLLYGGLTADACDPSCSVKSINLTNNQFQSIPSSLLLLNQLEKLYFAGNKLTNYTVTKKVFTALSSLKEFTVDPAPENFECRGQRQSIGEYKVCVVDETTTAAADSKSNGYLLYAIIAGSLVIAVLLFVLAKQGTCKRSTKGFEGKNEVDTMFDNTLSYDDSHMSINTAMMNDPIIIMHRIPYKEIRVATCINKGGFGLVYSGVYNRRRVAIKKIRADRSGDVFQIESFLREICLMATLSHPRIVEFIGVAWDSIRNLCAVTELMEKGDLREVLHSFKLRECRLTWDNHKTNIALHVAEALTYLHSLDPKVIHRDLKSKNILINGELQAKLSDFGISRERGIDETHMTAGIGTSFWIAPEVLLGRDYDERADIYSFGIVLCEIDTDDYPYWNAQNPPEGGKLGENAILRMVAAGSMRPAFSPDCPKPILELAEACLQADPDDRPTATQLVYAIQQMVRESHMSNRSFMSDTTSI